MDIDARAFGNLEGQVQALTVMLASQANTLAEQNKTLAALTMKLDVLATTMAEAKGGWKTVVWLSSLAATLGSVGTWFLTHTK